MRISFVMPGMGRSGGIKCTVRAADGLVRRGHQVRLLAYSSRLSLRSWARNLYLRARFPEGYDWVESFGGKAQRFTDICQCSFEDNEIVVASGWWAARELRKLKDRKIRKVHYIRGMAFFNEAEMRAAWGEDVPKIAVSEYLREAIDKMCGQKISAVISDGIDTDEYWPSLSESERDGVGTIYGAGIHKAPQTVLTVLGQLRDKRPDLPLHVFGACPRPKEIPRREYTRLPSLEKAREIYSRSLVWFLGSCSEGFPAPLLEAMCCGCAVVSTNCGGAADIVKDGENGMLVEVGDVSALVDKIELLLDDAGLRKKLVVNSRETIRKYSWNRSVNMLEEFLLSFLFETR